MTFYLTGSVPPAARHLLDSGTVGFMSSPNIGNRIQPGWTWAADNGCFSNYPGDLRWFSWLADNADKAADCLFAVAPDVVGDHASTLKRSLPWLPRIRALGYPVAFVGQNGATVDNVPWDAFDVLFIGGDTAWKLGPEAQSLAFYAKGVGKRVHLGRANPLLQTTPPRLRNGLRYRRRHVPCLWPRDQHAAITALDRAARRNPMPTPLIGAP